jgi:hypothetical protein
LGAEEREGREAGESEEKDAGRGHGTKALRAEIKMKG